MPSAFFKAFPVGTNTYCCPTGTEYRDGKCRYRRPSPSDEQTSPSDCQPGSAFIRGKCRRFREQRQEQQKSCPDGYELKGRRCRPVRNQQPDQGTPNNPPQTQQHDCPPGYRVLSKPNKYGAYCEIIPVEGPAPQQPQCTGGKVGPNCLCPLGMRENRDGQCVGSVN